MTRNIACPPRRWRRPGRPQGLVLVLVLVCLIPLLACVALAIDLGMMTLARTQIADATDAAALAGARALNGDTSNGANNNYAAAEPAALAAFTANNSLNKTLQSSELAIRVGRYTYDTTDERFEAQFPGPSTDNWNLVQATATVSLTDRLAFSKIINFAPPNIQVISTAAHRPRDIALVLDYSGSMRFGSIVGLPISGSRSCNNQDTLVPTFGHYSYTSAGMSASSPASPYDDANITTTTADGRGPIVDNFYTSSSGGAAFSAASSSYASTPAGDKILKINKNAGTTYAKTLAEVLNISSPTTSSRDASYESQGYKAYSMQTGQFNRYVQGPGYYGKTFFVWPPDPTNGTAGDTNDWRKQYFTYPSSTTPMDDNSRLWDTSGNWKAPSSSNYAINYTAILNFIKNIGPNPFPTRLQAGRILYYDAIPDTITTSTWPPTDLNQRFWKDYIDYVLGVMQTGSSSWSEITNYTGYGDDFAWGTVKITANSSLTGSPKPFMHYGDNPKRPKLHFWFGPLTMVDFLGNYNLWSQVDPDCSRYCWWPGTCREAPIYACKLGIRAALTDISKNHPNDMVSLIMFSVPKSSSSDTSATRFNRVRVGLSRDYASMQDSLWYPPATVGNSGATVRPYDSDNLEVPRAMGGTCYAMALMLAYNQFSSNAALRSYNTAKPTGDAGGNGRRGAQKIVIFETDGAPNNTASANLVSGSACQSYYAVRYNSANPGGSEYPTGISGYSDNSSTVVSQINALCSKIAADESAGGYSTGSRKALIHCIGFGPSAANFTTTINTMQTLGNVNDGMPSYKIVDGTEAQIITKLQTAIAKILQDGVQVSLIQ